MNTKALPAPILEIAHQVNLALLPRNHTYQTTLIPTRGLIVTVLRHATGDGITAVAVCGDVRLVATRWTWAVYHHAELLAESPAPTPILQIFWEQLQSVVRVLEETA